MVDKRGASNIYCYSRFFEKEMRFSVHKNCGKIRNYFAALSKPAGFENWVIAKVEIKSAVTASELESNLNSDEINVLIKKKKKDYALIIVEDNIVSFEVYLIRIVNKSNDGFNMSSSESCKKNKADFLRYLSDENMFLENTISFNKNEIMEFVCGVGDSNPIHRTENAVVPGLLMFEQLLELYSVLSCEIKYILPVFEEEKIEIYRKTDGLEAWIWRDADKKDAGYVKVFETRYSAECQ